MNERFEVGDVIQAPTTEGKLVRGDVLVVSLADLDGSVGSLSDGKPYLVGFPAGAGDYSFDDRYQARVWLAPEQMTRVTG